ncbi:MAG TPA: TauD/TfdA family dioxygenase [Pyrinomonadaceae bacterium]|nr:TauD/TfdA family dioxygenase [Pyrinomonadaceae bacterium]
MDPKLGRVEAGNVSAQGLTRSWVMSETEGLPLVIEPAADQLELVSWAAGRVDELKEQLLRYGAILFRGFKVGAVEQFQEFARTISPELLEYTERAAPRREIADNVYTSTEYPASQRILQHHEMSYSHNWPTKIWFYCVQPAKQGGATPVTNERNVFTRIDPKIKEIFMRKRVMYVRNYGDNLDMTWQDVFQTSDKAVVEDYCRRCYTEFEWKERGGLRTSQVRQAVATHPETGDMVWFNHAHMFHQSSLEPEIRALLNQEFDGNLPRDAFYGDGSRIEDSILDEIREVYLQSAVRFDWQENDVMMLDNFLTSHGRESFIGPRQILVAMSELYTNPATE